MAEKPGTSRSDPVLLGLLALAGAVLRTLGTSQSLYGDEVFTYDIVVGADGPADVVTMVHDTSITPPLHYLAAWASAQLGDPGVGVRLPSVVLGTATVVLVYLLGRRAVGRAAGLAGAAAFAIGPFALYYGSEARAYSMLTFLVAASTLTLLHALDTPRPRWWALFAVLIAAAFYTHYTALFVLVAQAAWALWAERERRREVLIAHAAAVLLWLPWAPSYLNQRANPGIDALGTLYELNGAAFAKGLVTVVAGHPVTPLGELPGAVGIALLAAGVLVGATAVLARAAAARPAPRLVLVVGLALASPVGVVLYQAVGTDIYAPRNMIASLPAACVALGALVMAPRGALRWASAGTVGLSLAIGAVQSLGTENRRTPWKEAARYIDAQAGPRDAVVQVDYFGGTDPLGRKPLLRSLQIELKRPHRVVEQLRWNDRPSWLRAARGGERVYATLTGLQTLDELPRAPELGPRLRLVERRDYDGFAPVSVLVYEVR